MIRTIVSIFITLGLIFALSAYEMYYVQTTFDYFSEVLHSVCRETFQEVQDLTIRARI